MYDSYIRNSFQTHGEINLNFKNILSGLIALGFATVAGVAVYVIILASNLPQLITVEDYSPLLVSEVFDVHEKKFGEFFREKRKVIPYEEIPKNLVNAFIAAEDSSFFEHNGINLKAILRAALVNIKAGRKVQGASTITQQVARTLLLTSTKTYTRKIKEVLLARQMESNLSKEDILFLYLNQIYLGQGAYGVKMAAEIYFRKDLAELNSQECALLAGLPKAPSRFSPIYNPKRAKERQVYVLGRMATEKFITPEEAKLAIESPLNVFVRKDYKTLAPFYLETIRQMLVEELGEVTVLDEGIKIYSSLDLDKQLQAQKQVRLGLRALDKRQGYRGPLKNIKDKTQITEFLLKGRNTLIDRKSQLRVLKPDGSFQEKGPLNLADPVDDPTKRHFMPDYLELDQVVEAIVSKVDDKWGIVHVRYGETRGLIDMESMKWARKPNTNVVYSQAEIKNPSEALKVGDVIQARIVGRKFYSSKINKELMDLKKKYRASKSKEPFERPEALPNFKFFTEVELEQEPLAEAALISFDQQNSDILAMVGGYDFDRSQFNRTYQAIRQTGSSFKPIVYLAALDKGYTPSTKILDAPLVYEETSKNEDESDNEEETITKWKPSNYAKKFRGDVLFRNALIRSLNIPTVKIIESIGVDWVSDYARRLGIFSPLNQDFTLALGSSSTTLYEMTKVFAQIGRMGKKIEPIIIHKVVDKNGKELIGKMRLDLKFEKELTALMQEYEFKRDLYLKMKRRIEAGESPEDVQAEVNEQLYLAKHQQETSDNDQESKTKTAKNEITAPAEEVLQKSNISRFQYEKQPHLYYKSPSQLVDPNSAYVLTNILQGVVEETGGTGARARALGRPVAGKTGSTSGFFDAWFIGFTADISTGVWVGYDNEKTLGRGEGGGRAALPIWVEYMKDAHKSKRVRNFSTPENIVFANIDNETGTLASSKSKNVIRQAFKEGTEPTFESDDNNTEKNDSEDNDQDFFKQEFSE